MPLRIFLSAGEPSGDLHGANLIRMLERCQPGVECVGFGGERMQGAGCRLLYPLTQLAVMWFLRAIVNGPTFLSLLSRADRFFRQQRPDAVVLIDYPGFNWWVARRAHYHGIPVFYFVPPQLWGWAGWRIGKMRRWVDDVLCTLPFEENWYRKRGVRAHYIGHPYFDELPEQEVDAAFVAEQRLRPEKIIALLPGSRAQEITRNLSTLVRAATLIHKKRPDTRFLVACFKAAHCREVERYLARRRLSYIEPHFRRTPEIIQLAHSCMAVSGSVGLELLYQAKPAVILYRIGRLDLFVCRLFKTSAYISLVNLLADREVFPEYLTARCEAEAMSGHVLHWLNEPAAYDVVRAELTALRAQVAEPGACERAARYILEALQLRQRIAGARRAA
jgi:lipid-A-disaccharide synthase